MQSAPFVVVSHDLLQVDGQEIPTKERKDNAGFMLFCGTYQTAAKITSSLGSQSAARPREQSRASPPYGPLAVSAIVTLVTPWHSYLYEKAAFISSSSSPLLHARCS